MTTDVNSTAGTVGWENAPSHYKGDGGIENFDVWDAYVLDPYSANAFKYLARHDKKGSALNDLMKAAHYVEETIIRLDKGILAWEPMPLPSLTPSKVVGAFDLSGPVSFAVTLLLLARCRDDNRRDNLQLVKVYIAEALAGLTS